VLRHAPASIGLTCSARSAATVGYGEVDYTTTVTPGAVVNLGFRRHLALQLRCVPGGIAPSGSGGRKIGAGRGPSLLDIVWGLDHAATGSCWPRWIINRRTSRDLQGVDRPGFDHDVIPTPGARSASARWAHSRRQRSGVSVYVVNGLRAGGFRPSRGSRGRQEGRRRASRTRPSPAARVGTPGRKRSRSFWYGGTADTNAAVDREFRGAGGAVLGGRALRERAVRVARVVGTSAERRSGVNGRVRAVVGSRIAGGMSRGPTICCECSRRRLQKLNAFLRHERYDHPSERPRRRDPRRSLARRITTFGLTTNPPDTAFKGDYRLLRNAAAQASSRCWPRRGYQF